MGSGSSVSAGGWICPVSLFFYFSDINSVVHFTVDAVNRHLTVRRNLRWFYFWRLTVGFTVIYGGKPSGFSYLRWETVSSWPGQARLNWLRAHTSPLGLIFGGHFIFISQMLFVGKSELELALWATEYLTPHRYLRFSTVNMNFTVSYVYVT